MEELQIRPGPIERRQLGIRQLFNIPLFRTRDTPIRNPIVCTMTYVPII
jgi:hypothetical protein